MSQRENEEENDPKRKNSDPIKNLTHVQSQSSATKGDNHDEDDTIDKNDAVKVIKHNEINFNHVRQLLSQALTPHV